MSKIDVVRREMMNAMKAGDKARKNALSMLLSALKSKAIDKREDLTEDEENAVVYREIKEAQETLDTTPSDRADVIEECKLKIAVYSEFAPQRMSKEEIETVVDAVLSDLGIENPSVKDKGRIMKELMPRVKGKAEGNLVNQVVTAKLS